METFNKANIGRYVHAACEACTDCDVYKKRVGNSGVYVIIIDGFTLFDTSELNSFIAGYSKGFMKGKVY